MDEKYYTNIMSGDQTISQRKFNVLFRKFAANKVNFTWFVTLILGLDASTFRWVKGACSVILFKGACALTRGAPLSGVIAYYSPCSLKRNFSSHLFHTGLTPFTYYSYDIIVYTAAGFARSVDSGRKFRTLEVHVALTNQGSLFKIYVRSGLMCLCSFGILFTMSSCLFREISY